MCAVSSDRAEHGEQLSSQRAWLGCDNGVVTVLRAECELIFHSAVFKKCP